MPLRLKDNKYIKYYSLFIILLISTSVLGILNHIAYTQVYRKQAVRDNHHIFSDKGRLKKYLEKCGVDETIAKIKASQVDCHQYATLEAN